MQPTDDQRRQHLAGADRAAGQRRVSTVAQLADIPEEEIWLPSRRARARGAPTGSTCSTSCATLGIATLGRAAPGRPQGGDRLGALHARDRARRSVDDPPAARGAVVALQAPGTPRSCRAEPGGEVERPAINRDEGSTLAFSKAQARKLLDVPAEETTVAGLRDRAILSVGLQVGLRRAEIAALKVGDLHQNRGYDFAARDRARAAAPTRWRSTRRPRRGFAPISMRPATPAISTGRCSGR